MTSAPPGSPTAGSGETWVETPRLVLRRPTREDLPGYVRLHTDPRTYAHRPSTMPSPERCAERLERDLEHWAADDVGYAAVLARTDGALLGWAGLYIERGIGGPHLNLYFRLAHDARGVGYGREIARALVAWAAEHRPGLGVSAVVADTNPASLATCRSAGLVDVGTAELPEIVLPEGSQDRLFRAPSVEVVRDVDRLTEQLLGELVDVWVRVNDAGGAVGFVPGTPVSAVRDALDEHLAEMSEGRATLCMLREAAGPLRGLGFWHHGAPLPHAHVAWLKRLMIDPEAQGRNLGRILLAAMVGVARRELSTGHGDGHGEGHGEGQVQVLRLEYRSGLGLGEFYGSCGWVETGRVPGGLWLGGDDYRDDVTMARRVDAAPLTGDGLT